MWAVLKRSFISQGRKELVTVAATCASLTRPQCQRDRLGIPFFLTYASQGFACAQSNLRPPPFLPHEGGVYSVPVESAPAIPFPQPVNMVKWLEAIGLYFVKVIQQLGGALLQCIQTLAQATKNAQKPWKMGSVGWKIRMFSPNVCDVCPSVYWWSSPIHWLSSRYFSQFSLHGSSFVTILPKKNGVWSLKHLFHDTLSQHPDNMIFWAEDLRQRATCYGIQMRSYFIWDLAIEYIQTSRFRLHVCQMWTLWENILDRWMQEWVADLSFDSLKFHSTVALILIGWIKVATA